MKTKPARKTRNPAVVYTYAKCSTCRDAVLWLNTRGIDFIEKPIKETPPTMDELQRMLVFQDGNLRRLFNTSGVEYRARGLSTKLTTMPVSTAFRLLASNGMLVKRPFVLGDSFGLLGFNETAWSKAFG